MPDIDEKVFSFETFTLDLRRGCLRREDREVELRPKSFEVLRYLVENAGRLVSKDELVRAVWPNVIVTDESLTRCVSDVRLALQDNGQQIIRTVPRRGYMFAAPVLQSAPSTEPSVHDRPSIAVLPFRNLSRDPEQGYFADGIVEDITMALSRFRWLFVIARNSSFTYRGQPVDVKQVGRELGVRYVLGGSVRKAGDRLRIAAQLIDAPTGAHLWVDCFDGGVGDIFDLQDQVTAGVVSAIAPKLERAEIERAQRKPTGSLDAYDYYLRGRASSRRWTREANSETLRLYYKAIELDPGFASAYGMAAWCYVQRKARGWMTDRVREMAEAARLARRAAELGKDDAVALSSGGFALGYVAGDVEEGAAFIDRALALNPNLAWAWLYSGSTRVWLGQPDVALEHLARAMHLSRLDPRIPDVQAAAAHAHFVAGRYDEASSWAEKALAETNFAPALRMAAASNAMAGRLERGQKFMARLRDLDPALRISDLEHRLPPFRPEHLARIAEGLRKAGLPE